MQTTFGILTALVIAITGWVGYKSHLEYKKQIKKKTASYDDFIVKTGVREKLQSDLDEQNDTIVTQLAQLEKQLDTRDGLNNDIVKLNEDIDAKNAILKANQQKIQEAEAALADLPKADILIPEIKRDQADLEKAKGEIQAEETRLANLKAEIKSTNDTNTQNEKTALYQRTGRSQESLNTKVKSVYSGWGFVLLAGGNDAGVVPGSTLLVKRDGETICELYVKNVTPNSASADIITETLKQGENIRLGDKVVPKPKPEPGAQASAN